MANRLVANIFPNWANLIVSIDISFLLAPLFVAGASFIALNDLDTDICKNTFGEKARLPGSEKS